MAYKNYFAEFEKYKICLEGQEGIISDSKSLLNNFNNSFSTIRTTYFDKIENCPWKENGKDVVVNSIITQFGSSLTNLGFSIEANLVPACDMAINKLLPIVSKIEEGDKRLLSLYDTLKQLEVELSTTPKTLKNSWGGWNKKGKWTLYESEYPNPRYFELIRLIADTHLEKQQLEDELDNLCTQARDIVEQIKSLQFLQQSQDFTSSIGTTNNVSTVGVTVVDKEKVDDPANNLHGYWITLSNGTRYFDYTQGFYREARDDGTILSESGCALFSSLSIISRYTGIALNPYAVFDKKKAIGLPASVLKNLGYSMPLIMESSGKNYEFNTEGLASAPDEIQNLFLDPYAENHGGTLSEKKQNKFLNSFIHTGEYSGICAGEKYFNKSEDKGNIYTREMLEKGFENGMSFVFRIDKPVNETIPNILGISDESNGHFIDLIGIDQEGYIITSGLKTNEAPIHIDNFIKYCLNNRTEGAVRMLPIVGTMATPID